jgi:hypothetical protein
MRVSMMVRWSTAAAALMFAAACADTATAPPQLQRGPAPSNLKGKALEKWLLENGGPDRDGRGREDKTDSVVTMDFVIDPTQPQEIHAGDHVVKFPANSICDPATSGYGEELWDAPCDPLQTPITIHATYDSKFGHASMQFEPALRFVPTTDPSQYVTITMKDYWDLDPNYQYPIFWQRPSDGLWLDESALDPTLFATKDAATNTVSRRLKHFSYYWLGGSEVCDAWYSSSCAAVSSFANYMLGGQ